MPLLDDIEKFCKDTALKETSLGTYAVKDSRFVERIRDGGRYWPETENKIRVFMMEYRQKHGFPPDPAAEPKKDRAA